MGLYRTTTLVVGLKIDSETTFEVDGEELSVSEFIRREYGEFGDIRWWGGPAIGNDDFPYVLGNTLYKQTDHDPDERHATFTPLELSEKLDEVLDEVDDRLVKAGEPGVHLVQEYR